ncbi:TPA: hypothetical protein ACPVZG_000469 [Vibrio parahaemolyticus]
MQTKIRNMVAATFASIALTGCLPTFDTYKEMDLLGQEISCGEMVERLSINYKYKRYDTVYDREKIKGYTFTQCRSEILDDHNRQCKKYVKTYFDSFYPRDLDTEYRIKRDKSCHSNVLSHVESLKADWRIEGNALIIDGVVYHKSSIVVEPVRELTSIGVKYFKVYVLHDKKNSVLIYLSDKEADDAYQKLVDFVSQ